MATCVLQHDWHMRQWQQEHVTARTPNKRESYRVVIPSASHTLTAEGGLIARSTAYRERFTCHAHSSMRQVRCMSAILLMVG